MSRFEQALAAFCRELPAGHRIVEGPDLRQLVCFGGTVAADGLELRSDAWLCIETARRRVQAFRCSGERTTLALAQLAELAALTDAGRAAQGTLGEDLEVRYERGGWRIAESVLDLECIFSDAESESPLTLCGVDAAILAGTAEGPVQALQHAFHERYPGFENEPARAEALERRLRRHVQPLLGQFLSRLQALPQEACRQLGRHGMAAYNTLAHAEERIALYRAQAARAIPALGALLVELDEPWLLPLRLAIDRRQPLAAAAARAFGVPKEAIRFLAGKPLESLGLHGPPHDALWRDSARFVMGCLAVVAPEHRPRDEAAWDAFFRLIAPLRPWHGELERVLAPFLRHAAQRGFALSATAIERKLGDLSQLGELDEYLECLEKALAKRPKRIAPASAAEFRRAYVQRRGLLKLALEAHRWRQAAARETTRRIAALERAAREAPWTLPIDVPREIGGHRIVFLGSGADMVAESVRMSNCLDTLYAAALEGERLPFSLRDHAERAIAAFDLSFVPGKTGYKAKINEICGPSNAEPSALACELVARFHRAVDKALKGRAAAIDRWREERQRHSARGLGREHARIVKRAEADAMQPLVARLTCT